MPFIGNACIHTVVDAFLLEVLMFPKLCNSHYVAIAAKQSGA